MDNSENKNITIVVTESDVAASLRALMVSEKFKHAFEGYQIEVITQEEYEDTFALEPERNALEELVIRLRNMPAEPCLEDLKFYKYYGSDVKSLEEKQDDRQNAKTQQSIKHAKNKSFQERLGKRPVPSRWK